LAEHVTWATYETLLKQFLGVSGTAEDALLEFWLESSAEMGDQYLERDFVDSTGVDIDPPKNTVLGCFAYVRVMRDWQLRQNTDLKKVKTGQLEEEYGISGSDAAKSSAFEAAARYWYPWKTDVSLAGVI
jgi:hypothetical protein